MLYAEKICKFAFEQFLAGMFASRSAHQNQQFLDPGEALLRLARWSSAFSHGSFVSLHMVNNLSTCLCSWNGHHQWVYKWHNVKIQVYMAVITKLGHKTGVLTLIQSHCFDGNVLLKPLLICNILSTFRRNPGFLQLILLFCIFHFVT